MRTTHTTQHNATLGNTSQDITLTQRKQHNTVCHRRAPHHVVACRKQRVPTDVLAEAVVVTAAVVEVAAVDAAAVVAVVEAAEVDVARVTLAADVVAATAA